MIATRGWRAASAERNCGQRRSSSVTTAIGRLESSGLSGRAIPAVVARANAMASMSAAAIVGPTTWAMRWMSLSCPTLPDVIERYPARFADDLGQRPVRDRLADSGTPAAQDLRSGRPDAAKSTASRTSRLLPMPAGPYTTASRGIPLSMASSRSPLRTASSRSRPTTRARRLRAGPASTAPSMRPVRG